MSAHAWSRSQSVSRCVARFLYGEPLGSTSQLQQLALASGPQAAPLRAMSELRSLDLFASRSRLDVLGQVAALAPHARQLTGFTLRGGEVLTVTGRLAELAASLRLLPELRSLEVRQAT